MLAQALAACQHELLYACRHYEIAAMLNSFSPLPPLRGGSLSGKAFYHFVVTDWSLIVMERDADCTVVLELPWLHIQEMVRLLLMRSAACCFSTSPHRCTTAPAAPGLFCYCSLLGGKAPTHPPPQVACCSPAASGCGAPGL